MGAESREVKEIRRDRNAQLHFLILLLLKLHPALFTVAANIPACAYQHANEPFYVRSPIPQGLVEP